MAVTVDRVLTLHRLEIAGLPRAQELGRTKTSADGEARTTILIVEENDVARCGLKLILLSQKWVSGCVSASDLGRATDLIHHSAPDVIIYGAKPRLDGAQQVGRALRAAGPESVLVLMSGADRVTPQTLSLVGAVAHISRNHSATDIVRAVRMASLGLTVSELSEPTILSTRQLEVLELLAAGQTNGEIGERLYLSSHTVKQHTCAIYRKLQVRNRAEAIQCAQGLGLLT
jgi:two-component system response regulator DesR